MRPPNPTIWRQAHPAVAVTLPSTGSSFVTFHGPKAILDPVTEYLLFRVQPNTVVLIDEPELSLHVGWQKRFLPDLVEIVQLSGFDAVVATHSPFIVGDRDDLLVPLGDG